MSQTYEGTVHDKKICDLEQYRFPDQFLLRYDLGYIGFDPTNTTIERPHKSTKLHPLTSQQKKQNRVISQKRVSIEQAISGANA